MLPVITGPTIDGNLCVQGGAADLSIDCPDATWFGTGPGNITFAPPTGPATSVTVDSPGNYIIGAKCETDLPVVGDCAGAALFLDGTGLCPAGPPTFASWSIANPSPAGANVTFLNQQNLSTAYIPELPGFYTFELKCYYYDAPGVNVVPPQPVNAYVPPALGSGVSLGAPVLDCPMAVIGGQTINVKLIGCEGNTVAWTATGAAVGTTFGSGNALGFQVPTTLTGSGPVTITATCTRNDGSTATVTCDVEVILFDPMLILGCETAVVEVEVNNCGFQCSESTVPVTFVDCGAEQCTVTYFTFVVEDPC